MQNSAHMKRERADTNIALGHCLCKAVQYEVHGPLRSVIYCHCGMCRRTSGHFVAATACDRNCLHVLAADALRWYPSSSDARRGFCQICGSNLFWEPVSGTHVSIMAGTLDLPTGLVAGAHIFVAEAGDYYQILDGLPQSPGAGPTLPC